jgi:Cys-tRNA(Pro)/Cys-tRNA(Cys) deacylase
MTPMKSVQKTNAIRIIESMDIPHEVVPYNFDESHLDALPLAKNLSVEPEMVFKTIVTHNENDEIYVFCIPGSYELNLKKAAQITNAKNIELIKMSDLLPLTGYVRGGCSPIGMKKNYPTYIDEIATAFDMIYVSGGVRGLQIRISPLHLAQVCNADFVNVI